MNENLPTILFQQKKDCCGCGACQNACPVNAIAMKEDDFGHLYPQIDETKCIRCGKCKKVCAFQKGTVQNSPLQTYAAQRKDRDALMRSSSGGIFAALAQSVLAQGGIVYGAAFDSSWKVSHQPVQTLANLPALLGSKYVQSETGNAYAQVLQHLRENKTVLYCGTPCQIAGLYGYLGKDWDNLITVDLVCHGVPSSRMFQDYLALLSRRMGGNITAFTFRDKSAGWAKNGSVTIRNGNKQKKHILWESASSYLYYFGQGWLSRESCGNCPYACAHRPADISLGDYWGIESAHPNYLKTDLSDQHGISIVLVNTPKGKLFFEEQTELVVRPSTFQKASAGNHRLCGAGTPGKRDALLELYRNAGWEGVEARFSRSIGWRRHISRIKHMIPLPLKRWLKRRAATHKS